MSTPPALSNCSVAESLALLNEQNRTEILGGLTEQQAQELLYDWNFWARPNQLPPAGDWRIWLMLAGRGWGKTVTGSQTIRSWSETYPRIHLIGPTISDTRNVMVEGLTGLLSCFPSHQRPVYNSSKHIITFHTGCIAETFSADEPERLRGPQCYAFWADEPCAWRFLQEAWDNLMFGWRLGDNPRGVVSTTPKPSKWLKDLMRDSATIITRGSSYDNRLNLAPAFFSQIIRKYEGTRLGRQEINAEVLEDTPGALWTQAMIDRSRIGSADVKWDQLIRVVVAIDPAVSAGEDSAEHGIVTVALTRTGHVLVLDDDSMRGSPVEWGRVALRRYHWRKGDRIIGEVNNGGDLVERNIRTIELKDEFDRVILNGANVPYRAVRASRGKAKRAQPVAALYEQGRVHHVGNFGELESQMTTYVPGDEDRGDSPDRMDALVWGITDLLIDPEQMRYLVPLGQVEEISPV
jgi:phage terminase large subunit-like protein